MGLAIPRESVGGVKERRKPGRRWQNRETGGGFPPNQPRCESTAAWEHLSMEGASGRESRPLDEGAVEAILVPRKRSELVLRMATGRDRERQRSDASLGHGRQHHAKAAHPNRVRPGIQQAERRAGAVRGLAEAGGAPSSAAQPGSDCRKAVRRRTGEPGPHGSGKHPAISAARAARPEVERFTGARVEGRLQRSVRSIFSGAAEGSREANQDGPA